MKPVVLIVSLVAGLAVLGILPVAFGQDSRNPLQALWDSIYDLQKRSDSLQDQIDELKQSGSTGESAEPSSEVSVELEIQGSELDEVAEIRAIVSNDGPDRAAGVRLTIFYKMPLFDIYYLEGGDCADLGRGIIECSLGTIAAQEQSTVTIGAAAREGDHKTTWTADVSSTTTDRIPTNNHKSIEFVTVRPDVESEVAGDLDDDPSQTDTGESDAPAGNSTNENEEQPQSETDGNQTSTTAEDDDENAEAGQDGDPADASNNAESQESTADQPGSDTDGEDQDAESADTQDAEPQEGSESSGNQTGAEGTQ